MHPTTAAVDLAENVFRSSLPYEDGHVARNLLFANSAA